MAGGRPSSYKPEYAEQAFKYALLGCTEERMATLFGITSTTIDTWKKKYPEFLGSLKAGRDDADTNISKSLYQSAKGYEFDEVQAVKLKTVKYKDGKRVSEIERVKMVTVHRVMPPVPTSIIYWLNNRQKDQWRNRNDHTTNGKDLPPGVSPVSEEELDARIEKLIARRKA